jgi:uncharacterized glyoxalase superfamily protein PhnB
MEMAAMAPMLQARDVEETVLFYTRTLEFKVEDSMADDDGRMSWCTLTWGGAAVMFYAMEPGDLDPHISGVLYFYPENVKTLWEQLQTRAPIEWDLQEMDYGMLEFAIRDPNGYILSFGQPLD